jgi:membrane AbrB-like protein
LPFPLPLPSFLPPRLADAAWHRIAPTLLVAGATGWLAQSMDLPLPWMIGPLFAVAGLRMCDLRLCPLPGGLRGGQWAIGTALGLYFTPEVVAHLGEHALLPIGAAAAALGIGLACALFTRRFAAVDTPTAFFASLPGGASEMATLADRFGGAVDRIAAAHAIRVMMVVSVVPFALSFAGAHGSDLYTPPLREVDAARFPLLLAASLAGVALLGLLRVANAWGSARCSACRW